LGLHPLEAKYEEVNRRILVGENPHVKLRKKKNGEITWTLPYVGNEETGAADMAARLMR